MDDELDKIVDKILATLIHTYLAKITKPRNNTELEAYNKKIAKLHEAVTHKILTWHNQKLAELEKAYGGCHKCYGKGYATVRSGTRTFNGKYENTPIKNNIKYCMCDRGKQLELVVAEAVREARSKLCSILSSNKNSHDSSIANLDEILNSAPLRGSARFTEFGYNEFKRKLLAWKDSEVRKARADQINLDEIAYSANLDVDESQTIKIREALLKGVDDA